jgi:hypothetical protein
VWTVRLDIGGEIGKTEFTLMHSSLTLSAEGDSGSWVIDPKTGDLWGHIVAGCPESRVGHMVLARHIFNDITTHLGGWLELASPNAAAPLADLQGSSSSTPITEPCQKITALGINQSKAELLRHLSMSEAVYSQMAVSPPVYIIFDPALTI